METLTVRRHYALSVRRHNALTVRRHHALTVRRHHTLTVRRHHGLTVRRHYTLTVRRHHALTVRRHHAFTVRRHHPLTVRRHYALTVRRHYTLTVRRHYALTVRRHQVAFLRKRHFNIAGKHFEQLVNLTVKHFYWNLINSIKITKFYWNILEKGIEEGGTPYIRNMQLLTVFHKFQANIQCIEVLPSTLTAPSQVFLWFSFFVFCMQQTSLWLFCVRFRHLTLPRFSLACWSVIKIVRTICD